VCFTFFDFFGERCLNAYNTRRKSDENRLAEHSPSGSALLVITFVVYFDNIGPFNLNDLARRQIYFKHAFFDRGVYIFKVHRGRYAGDYTRDRKLRSGCEWRIFF
jgi:hypothetical protein